MKKIIFILSLAVAHGLVTELHAADFSLEALQQAADAYRKEHGALAEMQNLEKQENGFVPLMLNSCFNSGNSGCPVDKIKAQSYEGKKAEIKKQLHNLLDHNNVDVYYWLAFSQNSYKQAIPWLIKAADYNHVPSLNMLGRIYSSLNEHDKAYDYYNKAAQSGDATAIYNLAGRYREGLGVAQDYAKAVELYEKAINLNNVHAMLTLGYMYFDGIGVTHDFKKAEMLYLKAANLGDTSAMNWLGIQYEQGIFFKKDNQQAIAWFKKAKELGHAEAKQNLSRLNPGIWSKIGKSLGEGLIAVGSGVADFLEDVVDIAGSPQAVAVLQEQNASMQREFDRQRRAEIERRAMSSARSTSDLQRTSSASSSTRVNASSSTSTTNSTSSHHDLLSSAMSRRLEAEKSIAQYSDRNDESYVREQKAKEEKDKQLRVEEQKRIVEQRAEQERLAKEQRAREEAQRQRDIQLAKEKREKERQAEKERIEREKLAQKQREEQERRDYLNSVKNNLKLRAIECYGNNYAVGQMPKGLSFSNRVSGINVQYRAYCPGGRSNGYTGISKNFVGMGTSCFTGDTSSNDGGLIPKNALSCKAEEMTIDVINVTPTR